ncbi:MAG: hypothetical protein ACJ8EH_03835 [Sphingomicrobium sp.]
MENDSIRTSGSNTLVDIWIEGKMRSLCVSQQAIGAFIGFDEARGMTDRERCEFVRTHLPLVLTAVRNRLRETDFAADAVTIEVGELARPDGASGDRRKADRRRGDRRKADLPKGKMPERRRGDRRQRERRTSSPKQD